MTTVRVSRTGSCIDILSLYDVSADRTVEISQTAGCPASDVVPGVTPGWEHLAEVRVADDDWRVMVIGESADAETVAANVTAVPFAEPGPAPRAGFDADAQAQFCRSWSMYESTLADRGYIVVTVTGDRSVRFDPDGSGPVEPGLIDLIPSPTLPGVRAGLIDIDRPLPLDQVSSLEDIVTVIEADGTRTPCIQN